MVSPTVSPATGGTRELLSLSRSAHLHIYVAPELHLTSPLPLLEEHSLLCVCPYSMLLFHRTTTPLLWRRNQVDFTRGVLALFDAGVNQLASVKNTRAALCTRLCCRSFGWGTLSRTWQEKGPAQGRAPPRPQENELRSEGLRARKQRCAPICREGLLVDRTPARRDRRSSSSVWPGNGAKTAREQERGRDRSRSILHSRPRALGKMCSRSNCTN